MVWKSRIKERMRYHKHAKGSKRVGSQLGSWKAGGGAVFYWSHYRTLTRWWFPKHNAASQVFERFKEVSPSSWNCLHRKLHRINYWGFQHSSINWMKKERNSSNLVATEPGIIFAWRVYKRIGAFKRQPGFGSYDNRKRREGLILTLCPHRCLHRKRGAQNPSHFTAVFMRNSDVSTTFPSFTDMMSQTFCSLGVPKSSFLEQCFRNITQLHVTKLQVAW